MWDLNKRKNKPHKKLREMEKLLSGEKGDPYKLVCPVCGGSQVVLTGGTEELQIREMDVD